jgi:mRNA (guanine-N7-)-methyltransferase
MLYFAGEYLRKLKNNEVRGVPMRVLDLGCGKGGDLLKWMRSNVSHVVCADVAEVSMQHCESRYKDMIAKKRASFTAQFITADCTKVNFFCKFNYYIQMKPTL